MAVPKQRKSKSKSRSRRAQYLKLKLPTINNCPNCGSPKLPHSACGTCGFYKNKIVISYSE